MTQLFKPAHNWTQNKFLIILLPLKFLTHKISGFWFNGFTPVWILSIENWSPLFGMKAVDEFSWWCSTMCEVDFCWGWNKWKLIKNLSKSDMAFYGYCWNCKFCNIFHFLSKAVSLKLPWWRTLVAYHQWFPNCCRRLCRNQFYRNFWSQFRRYRVDRRLRNRFHLNLFRRQSQRWFDQTRLRLESWSKSCEKFADEAQTFRCKKKPVNNEQ